MSEEKGTDHQSKKPSDEWQSLTAVLAALGVIASAAGAVVSIINGGRLLFGVCLIIFGISIGVALAAGRIWPRVKGHWRVTGVAAVSVLLVGAGITLVVTRHANVVTPHTSTTACQRPAVISGADTSALQFTVAVNLLCARQSGDQLFLVEQLLNEGVAGTVKHSEYFLAWDVRNTAGLQNFADAPAGCVTRRYYLIEVTQDQLALLQQSQRTKAGAYFGDPIDTIISKYIVSNVQTNHTCNPQA